MNINSKKAGIKGKSVLVGDRFLGNKEGNVAIKLSEANTLKYFWKERRDFICFVTDNPDYKELEKEYPLLFEGIKRIEQGEAMIDYILDKMEEESINDLVD